MKFSDVYLDRREWLISLTKNGKPQVVYLHVDAVAILQRRQAAAKSDLLFLSRGDAFKATGFDRAELDRT